MSVYQKIASLSPRATELLLALGASEKLLGAVSQKSSRYPLFATVPSLGQVENVTIEHLKSIGTQAVYLTPDVPVAENFIDELKSNGIDVITFDAGSIDEVEREIYRVARTVARSTQAEKLVTRMMYGIDETRRRVKDMEPIRTAFFTGREPYTVAAGENIITELLEVNALSNVYKDIAKKDAQVDLSTLKLLDPQLILLPDSPVSLTDDDAFTMGQYTEHALTVFVPGDMFTPGVGMTMLGDFYRELNEKMRRFTGENLANRGVPTYF